MKKSPRLLTLSKCNNLLGKQAENNYFRFLDTLLGSIDHPFSRELHSLLKASDYTNMVLVADRISSTVFQTASEHRTCNQLAAVIRKYPFPKDLVMFDPRKKALETFLASERKCKRVNKKFLLFRTLRSPHEFELSTARAWIHYVLGELSLTDVMEGCNFGPGASIGIHGNATNMARKLLAPKWSVTPSAFYYAQAFLKTDVHIREYLVRGSRDRFFSFDNDLFNQEFASKVRFVDYNNISFVPKTAKTERTIAVEPLLNGYIQKGIDVLMRKKLKRAGIDLDDQSHNQGLARLGSIPGFDDDPYVTIDLSSASDSISIELCRYMLPPDWFDLMNHTRSSCYMIEGLKTPYEKFTTMGNGFCFPLETLLFASLCHTASIMESQPSDFSVYGDDIIVRQSVADRVLDLLRICGFKANREKTFLQGPFRESCGADWFEGVDVRPVTLDYRFDSVESIFKFCNLARRKTSLGVIFHKSLEFLESLVPHAAMFTRPYPGNVDTALEVSLDSFLSSPFSRWNRNTQTWSWLEIQKEAWTDLSIQSRKGYELALTRGALTGSQSRTPFAERRRTRTKIRRISYSGGWSLYLPGSLFSQEERDFQLLV